MFAHRAEHLIGTGDGTGMRGCGLLAGIGDAELKHDQRFFTLGRVMRKVHEGFAVADRFERHHHHVSLIAFEHEARKINHGKVSLVAAARLITHVHAGLDRAPHHIGLPQPAALADQADIARGFAQARHRVTGGEGKTVDKIHRAVAVGTHHAQPRFAGEAHQFFLQLAPLLGSGLGITGSEYRRALHADGMAFAQHIDDAVGCDHHADMVRRFRQRADAGITLQAIQFREPWIHRQDASGIAEFGNLPHQPATEAPGVIRRSDNSNGFGRVKTGPVGGLIHCDDGCCRVHVSGSCEYIPRDRTVLMHYHNVAESFPGSHNLWTMRSATYPGELHVTRRILP